MAKTFEWWVEYEAEEDHSQPIVHSVKESSHQIVKPPLRGHLKSRPSEVNNTKIKIKYFIRRAV
jgi:hypothetical protein